MSLFKYIYLYEAKNDFLLMAPTVTITIWIILVSFSCLSVSIHPNRRNPAPTIYHPLIELLWSSLHVYSFRTVNLYPYENNFIS